MNSLCIVADSDIYVYMYMHAYQYKQTNALPSSLSHHRQSAPSNCIEEAVNTRTAKVYPWRALPLTSLLFHVCKLYRAHNLQSLVTWSEAKRTRKTTLPCEHVGYLRAGSLSENARNIITVLCLCCGLPNCPTYTCVSDVAKLPLSFGPASERHRRRSTCGWVEVTRSMHIENCLWWWYFDFWGNFFIQRSEYFSLYNIFFFLWAVWETIIKSVLIIS